MKEKHTEQEVRDTSDAATSSVAEAGFRSPQNLTEAFIRLGLRVPPEVQGHWVLCGEMPAAMYDASFGPDAPAPLVHVAYCRTPGGGTYLVITHQAMCRQHRFLIPLWDAEVLNAVKVMREGRMRVVLMKSQGPDAAVYALNLGLQALDAAVVKTAPTDPAVLEKLLMELPEVVASVRELDAIPGSAEMEEVSEVAVSVVPPIDATLRFIESAPKELRH